MLPLTFAVPPVPEHPLTGLIDVFSVYPSVKQAVSGAKLARPMPVPAL
jgi:hypothetical protein